MPPVRQCQIKAHEIHRGRGLDVSLSLAAALSTIKVAVRFGSVLPQFFGRKGVQGPPSSLTLPPTSREDMRPDGYFRVPSCCKGTIHLQTFMPSLGFVPKPFGTAVNVINHYTGWATQNALAHIGKILNKIRLFILTF
ncbi:hypothetical protein TNCV_2658141 [Trichonephila clavipes]|nr:hypothetical protein TNCV_2658141 [Trichonephila clavipes]